MVEFERKVLLEVSGEPQEGLVWGAAMAEAVNYLQGRGYITRSTKPQITELGQAALLESKKDNENG